MMCPCCRQSEMEAATFIYEHKNKAGIVLRREVHGLRCPVCLEEQIFGRDAEAISNEWRRLTGALTDPPRVEPGESATVQNRAV